MRAEIRAFLSSRRAKITPEHAGLPTYGGDRRRVPSPRREEAALLVGVSPQYFIRLERGDATGVSNSVIDGITHALNLDEAERTHLLDLLRTAGTPARARQPRPPTTRRVRPTIQRLVASIQMPAVVLTGRLDVIAMNPLGKALFAPLHDDGDELNSARIVPGRAGDHVLPRMGQGRQRHRRPAPCRVRWAAHDVRVHNTGIKEVHPDVVGDLDLPFESLPIEAGSSASVVTYLPEPDSPSHQALALLASWARNQTDPFR